MKTMKTLLATAIAASSVMVAVPASAELGASVSLATAYLWRGQDLGNGSPAISGDIVYSAGGAYGGIWGSSGDDSLGNEYDLFVGYGTEIGDFSVDLSVWNYIYPDAGNGDDFGAESDTFGDLSEAILSVGFGPVSVTYYDNIAGASGTEYITLGAEFGAFSVTYGMWSGVEAEVEPGVFEDANYAHLDIGYAFNDTVSFTLSQVIDKDDAQGADDDLNFVVSYSLPIGE